MWLTPKAIAIAAAEAAADKRALDVVVLDLNGLTIMTDFFVIASAETTVQVRAIAQAVHERLEELGKPYRRREGWDDARWVLLDYGDVIVHVFRQPDREYYDLERLWGDAPRLELPAATLSGQRHGGA